MATKKSTPGQQSIRSGLLALSFGMPGFGQLCLGHNIAFAVQFVPVAIVNIIAILQPQFSGLSNLENLHIDFGTKILVDVLFRLGSVAHLYLLLRNKKEIRVVHDIQTCTFIAVTTFFVFVVST
ncbi:MAG: hypothetical protein RIC16_15460 [Rhodospirillales bacterium]